MLKNNMNLKKINNDGMTFPELVLAILMLTAFTTITAMVTQFTTSFFQPLEVDDKELRYDWLNDNLKINKAFDSIIEFLSQPGIDKNTVLNIIDDPEKQCTSLPKTIWKIPTLTTNAIPKTYKICLKKSGFFPESNYTELANRSGKAGIYILYSKPAGGVTVNAFPIRRIFCRPKPFCKPQL